MADDREEYDHQRSKATSKAITAKGNLHVHMFKRPALIHIWVFHGQHSNPTIDRRIQQGDKSSECQGVQAKAEEKERGEAEEDTCTQEAKVRTR